MYLLPHNFRIFRWIW